MNNDDAEYGSAGMAGTAEGIPTDKLIRKRQLAELLQVTPRTIENYMRARRIPYRKSGRRVFFNFREVEAALFVKVEVEKIDAAESD